VRHLLAPHCVSSLRSCLWTKGNCLWKDYDGHGEGWACKVEQPATGCSGYLLLSDLYYTACTTGVGYGTAPPAHCNAIFERRFKQLSCNQQSLQALYCSVCLSGSCCRGDEMPGAFLLLQIMSLRHALWHRDATAFDLT